jgi:hypothetical protein
MMWRGRDGETNWGEVGVRLERKDSSIVKWRRYHRHTDRQINEDEHYYKTDFGFIS